MGASGDIGKSVSCSGCCLHGGVLFVEIHQAEHGRSVLFSLCISKSKTKFLKCYRTQHLTSG